MKQFYKQLSLMAGGNKDRNWRISVRISNKGRVLPSQIVISKRTPQCFFKHIHGDGICLFCGEIDFAVLDSHHPYPDELPNFKITLCANCHRRLHFYSGGNIAIRR